MSALPTVGLSVVAPSTRGGIDGGIKAILACVRHIHRMLGEEEALMRELTQFPSALLVCARAKALLHHYFLP